MKKVAGEIKFQDDVDLLAEEITTRIERKLELTEEVGYGVFEIVLGELCELFPDLEYNKKEIQPN